VIEVSSNLKRRSAWIKRLAWCCFRFPRFAVVSSLAQSRSPRADNLWITTPQVQKNTRSQFAPLLLLSPETIRRMPMECAGSGFYPPFVKGRCEKIEIFPLTPPSPARGEGKHIEIEKNSPPPGRGRARVGVIYENFSHLQGGRGDFRYKPAAEISPYPPFSNGGEFLQSSEQVCLS
jgi:hypothetical protein